MEARASISFKRFSNRRLFKTSVYYSRQAFILLASPAATPLDVVNAALDLRSRSYSFHESLHSVLELLGVSYKSFLDQLLLHTLKLNTQARTCHVQFTDHTLVSIQGRLLLQKSEANPGVYSRPTYIQILFLFKEIRYIVT